MTTTEPDQKTTVTVTIDGVAVEAKPGELLIKVAQEHGVYIPRFCWHERMKPVGMCRMCLVEVEGARGYPPACTTPVTDGMVCHTQTDTVKKIQDGVLEFLLINHPLDCPVCDRGGECPLQDQTLAFGPGESRFVEEKRHWEKPIRLSKLILLDRERCIQCARCTRFADEIAGDPLIDFVDRSERTQVLNFAEQPFDSYFSGNTVQICPVGALTASQYRFRARPWDLSTAETSCTTCAVQCRGAVQSSSNRLVRLLGVDSEPVNHGWLCDKGRYGIEWVHSERRVLDPHIRRDGEPHEVSWPEALDAATAEIKRVRDLHGPGAIAVLGGARGTNEDAYTWARLAKGVIGTDNVDAQLGDGLPAEVVLGLPRRRDRRLRHRRRDRVARPEPQGGTAGPVPPHQARGRARSPDRRSRTGRPCLERARNRIRHASRPARASPISSRSAVRAANDRVPWWSCSAALLWPSPPTRPSGRRPRWRSFPTCGSSPRSTRQRARCARRRPRSRHDAGPGHARRGSRMVRSSTGDPCPPRPASTPPASSPPRPTARCRCSCSSVPIRSATSPMPSSRTAVSKAPAS